MIPKCYWCQRELEEQYSFVKGTVWECYKAHCSILIDDNNFIPSYRLYLDRQEQRYKIVAFRDENITSLLIKSEEGDWNPKEGAWSYWREVIAVQRHLNLTIAEDGTVQGRELFDKLKTLLLFS